MSWTPITCFFSLVGLENDLSQILQQIFFDALSGLALMNLTGLRRSDETFKDFVKLLVDDGPLDRFSRRWLFVLVILCDKLKDELLLILGI